MRVWNFRRRTVPKPVLKKPPHDNRNVLTLSIGTISNNSPPELLTQFVFFKRKRACCASL